MKIMPAQRSGEVGFTLVGLVTVVVILFLLAAAFLPALRNAGSRAGQMQCLNNLKQVGFGVLQYLPDNNDIFPACASRNTYGFQPEDWIYWRTNRPGYSVEKSPTAKYIPSFSTNKLRCPLDRDDSERKATSNDSHGLYHYSYSMLSRDTAPSPLGMSSIFDGVRRYYFKQEAIRNPANKLMMVEEQTSHKRNESIDPGGSSSIIWDGRFVPGSDKMTARHNKRGQTTFADGHAENVRPRITEIAKFSVPTF
jgi:prepilin-type processing-associated H-X9-DG protein